MPAPQLKDQVARPILRGRQIGRKGGEGTVFEAVSHPGYALKLYHNRPNPEKVAKILHLVALSSANAALLKFAAWPTSLVTGDGKPVGFLMPLVKGKEIHQLFSPRERSLEFPLASWDFLVNVARNCAAAFDSIHRLNVVIGDVNEGNILVTPQGIVNLIDCDSYQVDAGADHWTCDVGVPLWTPPELQGKTFRGLRRTSNHDLFGLAVLIFKMLFMGRHPYAGVPTRPIADRPLEASIAEYMFAFSRQAHVFGIKAPPHSLDLAALPDDCGKNFETAFLRGSERKRPTAADWVTTLDKLIKGLTKCGRDPSHRFPAYLHHCPWCAIADSGGPRFFISLTATLAGGANAGTILWASIVRVEPIVFALLRVEDVVPASAVGRPLPAPANVVNFKFIAGCALFILSTIPFGAHEPLLGLSFLSFAAGLVSGGAKSPIYYTERDDRYKTLSGAQDRQKTLFDELSRVHKDYEASFRKCKTELGESYRRLSNLSQERNKELQQMENNKREFQLREFLDRQMIAKAGITGIGSSRVATLQAYGVETALDITQRINVPGIGAAYTARLVSWRRLCEAKFRFNPLAPLPADEVRLLDSRLNGLRTQLETRLRDGAKILADLNAATKSHALNLEDQIRKNCLDLAQATADTLVLK